MSISVKSNNILSNSIPKKATIRITWTQIYSHQEIKQHVYFLTVIWPCHGAVHLEAAGCMVMILSNYISEYHLHVYVETVTGDEAIQRCQVFGLELVRIEDLMKHQAVYAAVQAVDE